MEGFVSGIFFISWKLGLHLRQAANHYIKASFLRLSVNKNSIANAISSSVNISAYSQPIFEKARLAPLLKRADNLLQKRASVHTDTKSEKNIPCYYIGNQLLLIG
jgi:hypothetical protein